MSVTKPGKYFRTNSTLAEIVKIRALIQVKIIKAINCGESVMKPILIMPIALSKLITIGNPKINNNDKKSSFDITFLCEKTILQERTAIMSRIVGIQKLRCRIAEGV